MLPGSPQQWAVTRCRPRCSNQLQHVVGLTAVVSCNTLPASLQCCVIRSYSVASPPTIVATVVEVCPFDVCRIFVGLLSDIYRTFVGLSLDFRLTSIWRLSDFRRTFVWRPTNVRSTFVKLPSNFRLMFVLRFVSCVLPCYRLNVLRTVVLRSSVLSPWHLTPCCPALYRRMLWRPIALTSCTVLLSCPTFLFDVCLTSVRPLCNLCRTFTRHSFDFYMTFVCHGSFPMMHYIFQTVRCVRIL
jgi:hypothetical protein